LKPIDLCFVTCWFVKRASSYSWTRDE